jgi:lactoylglutathione lyase
MEDGALGTTPMTGRRLDYVILFVSDLERSIDFYRDVIGLDFKLKGDGYAEFATKGTKFALFERAKLPELIGRDPDSEPPSEPRAEVVFVVPDVDAEADHLSRAGAEILSGPVDRPWGHRTVHVADPDGHVVEFAQDIPRPV